MAIFRESQKQQLKIAMATFAFALSNACGKADFQGDNNSGDAGAGGVNWLWDCQGDGTEAEQTNPNILSIKGEGPHELNPSQVDGVEVKMSGEVCAGGNMARHILLVIDVSGSMTQDPKPTDPMKDGTCGRFEAVKNVIASASRSGKAKFAITTFSDEEEASSSELFSTQDELFADLLAKNTRYNTIEDLICDGISGTNYEAGLIAGGKILNQASSNAARELYFISDGEPSTGQAGKQEAIKLKKDSVIATVMVGNGNDDILKNDIASRDERGLPLHSRAENSADLANVLAALAENSIEKATFSFRYLNQEDWQSFDIRDKIKSGKFSFDGFAIDTSAADGIEIEIFYHDRFGHEQRQRGQIVWAGN